MVGVETPGDTAAVETGFQFCQHAAVAHALDALSLVAFRNIGADEWKGHAVEFSIEHHVHIVNQLARDAVLVGGDADAELRHRPIHARPVQGGETRADADGGFTEPLRGGGKDRGFRIVFLDQVLEAQEVFPCRGKRPAAVAEID